jgi:hypothetical protein
MAKKSFVRGMERRIVSTAKSSASHARNIAITVASVAATAAAAAAVEAVLKSLKGRAAQAQESMTKKQGRATKRKGARKASQRKRR